MRLLTAAVTALSVSATAAFASGPVDRTPAPPVIVPERVADWSGFYGGLSFGAVSYDWVGNAGGPLDSEDSTEPGAFIGYNFQSGNIVYGAELNYQMLEAPLVAFPNSIQHDVLQVRGRVGYVVMPDLLLYGFVGFAQTSFNDGGTNYDQTGPAFGIGADYMLSRNFFAGIEYSYSDTFGEADNNPALSIESDVQVISLRVGFKF